MRALLAAAALATVLLTSCNGDNSGRPEPSPTSGPTTEAARLPVSGRVTFYAADAGDSGGTLAAGDFNGDGRTDLLFAAAFADGPDNQRADAGEAYVFLGPFRPGETRDAAAGQQDLTVYGAGAGDQTGRSAAAADINGDGIDDIILGAPFADGPDGKRQDAGGVDVVFGSPRLGREVRTVDLRQGSDLTLYGRGEGDLAGFAVATADLNGDRVADLVIGAFWADGPSRERPNAGEVYGVFGSPGRAGVLDFAAGAQDITVYGRAADDRLGEGVAAGDVNGDGLADLILSAPFAPGRQGPAAAGQAYVIYSPAPPQVDIASGGQNVTIYGVDQGDQLGHMAAAGDVDGDGVADILLTAVSADGEGNTANLAGEAVLVRGGSLPALIDVAAGQADRLIYGADSGDRLGRSAALGDIDGDGRMDLLLGAPGGAGEREASPDSGELYVLRGRDPATKVVRLPVGALVYAGDDAGDNLASEVWGRLPLIAADMDGDGRDEILVAAPLGNGPDNSRPDCGEAYILFVAVN